MSIQDELLDMLETVAEALGDDLCRQMVFVGGCSTAVLITDEITLQEVRATDDVDLIVGLTGMAQWMQPQKTLNKKGFTVSGKDDVICRMRLGNLKVDFMPDDPDILGFSPDQGGPTPRAPASAPDRRRRCHRRCRARAAPPLPTRLPIALAAARSASSG